MIENIKPTSPQENSWLKNAILDGNQEAVSFLLKNQCPVDRETIRCALMGDADWKIVIVGELLSTFCRQHGTVFNLLEIAPSIESCKWLMKFGYVLDHANADGKFPYEINPDPEVAAFLQEEYEKLHPRPVLMLPDAGAVQEELEFTNSQLAIQDLHAVNYNPQNGMFQIEYEGETYLASSRFLSSLARKLKVSTNIFRYFSGEEVLNRAAERNPELAFRATFDHKRKEILGVVDTSKKILPPEIAKRIFEEDPRTKSLSYRNGIISAEMLLDNNFEIADDSEYKRKLTLHYPVDGVNLPSIYLAVERQICTNGMTALVDSFRTEIEVNDNSGTHLSRLISSFNNENGFKILEGRILKAQQTLASVREVMELQNLLLAQIPVRSDFNIINERLDAIAGDPCAQYEVTSLNNIAVKRRALLPVQCSVNDLINFCSELTTHHRDLLINPNRFHVTVGKMLSQEFDLEEMYHNQRPARSFYLDRISNRENHAQNERVYDAVPF